MKLWLPVVWGVLSNIAGAQQPPYPPGHFDVEQEIQNSRRADVEAGFRAEYKNKEEAMADDRGVTSRALPRSTQASVSALHLAHKPSKAARKEFIQGEREKRNDHQAQAMEHFAAAARLDPQYFEAHAELGSVYAWNSRVPEALEQFELGLELEPNSKLLHIGRAWALLSLNRFAESEQEARRALELDPHWIDAHFFTALTLIAQGRLSDETREHLKVAGPKYPEARAALRLIEQAGAVTSSPR